VAFTILTLIIGGILISGFGYYNNQYYAKRLINAIKSDDVQRVEHLVKSPFGNIESLPIISKLFARISEQEFSTPLQEACRAENYEIIKLLVDHGADVNYVVSGMNEYSPLMLAAYGEGEEKSEIIRLLVEEGANIEYSHHGESAMTRLAEINSDRSILLIEYLESRGGKIEEGHDGDSLLHYACKSGSIIVIKYLVSDRRFDVNAKGFNGATPLIAYNYPVKHKSIDGLTFLLENGSDKSIKDNDNKTAYDHALESYPDFAEMLKP